MEGMFDGIGTLIAVAATLCVLVGVGIGYALTVVF